MKNLLEMLRNSGLSEEQAHKTIGVIHEWLEKTYPVLATLSKNTLLSMRDEVRDVKRGSEGQSISDSDSLQ